MSALSGTCKPLWESIHGHIVTQMIAITTPDCDVMNAVVYHVCTSWAADSLRQVKTGELRLHTTQAGCRWRTQRECSTCLSRSTSIPLSYHFTPNLHSRWPTLRIKCWLYLTGSNLYFGEDSFIIQVFVQINYNIWSFLWRCSGVFCRVTQIVWLLMGNQVIFHSARLIKCQ